ncbi:hypothetical protein LJ737_19665 [Hymenobacter sp. 15J16-1T3B]|nr:hypothetical protein [Hymenobacter sp. 15J16-1T3B]MCC3159469.1 hypothetical protein [Hymenobacter sp. 15J16-1T3B]
MPAPFRPLSTVSSALRDEFPPWRTVLRGNAGVVVPNRQAAAPTAAGSVN